MFCCVTKAASAFVTHPLHARQSFSVIRAIAGFCGASSIVPSSSCSCSVRFGCGGGLFTSICVVLKQETAGSLRSFVGLRATFFEAGFATLIVLEASLCCCRRRHSTARSASASVSPFDGSVLTKQSFGKPCSSRSSIATQQQFSVAVSAHARISFDRPPVRPGIRGVAPTAGCSPCFTSCASTARRCGPVSRHVDERII